jgi:ParB/RepB/Spo0J family partition protein
MKIRTPEKPVVKKHAKITLESWPLSKLTPHPKNPRKHPATGSEGWLRLKQSLQNVYFDPLVINRRNGLLVSGHLRKKVMEEMGYHLVDVVVIEVSEEEHIALLMGANKQIGEFDYPQVTKLLRELQSRKNQLFFHGFDNAEVKDLLKGNFEVVVPDGPGGVPPGGTTPMVLVSKLKASPYVVHAMTEGEYARLLETIRGVGILNPLLLRKLSPRDKLYEIIDGHQRWKAAKELGIEAVPCKIFGGLSDATALLIALATGGIGGQFLPSEVGKHVGGMLQTGQLSAREVKIAAAMEKARVLLHTAPEGVDVNNQEANFKLDENGVPQRTMRNYVAGKDYQPLVEGQETFIEFQLLLKQSDYEKVAKTLNAIDKDWSVAILKMAEYTRKRMEKGYGPNAKKKPKEKVKG